MGAVAAARRTQSAFPDYLASTNPSDLTVLTGLTGPASGFGYDPAVVRAIARLPHVRRVESYAGLNVAVLGPNGAPQGNAARAAGQHRRRVLQPGPGDHRSGPDGQPGPGRRGRARREGHPRPRCTWVTSCPSASTPTPRTGSPDFGKPGTQPYLRINAKVVGKALFSREVVQDDADAGLNGGALFTPALTRRLARCCARYTESAISSTAAAAMWPPPRPSIERVLPSGFPVGSTSPRSPRRRPSGRSSRSRSPSACSAGSPALAALLIAGQVIGRQLRLGADDLGALRALGAGPAMTAGDGLIGVLGAVVWSVACWRSRWRSACRRSRRSGPVRPVYPVPGRRVRLDGARRRAAAVLIVVLSRWSRSSLAYRRRAAPRRSCGAGARPGAVAAWRRAAAASGPPAAGGRRGSGSRSIPGRTQRGAGALGDPRRGAGHRSSWSPRSPSARACNTLVLAPRALRVELELRAERRRPDVHPPAASGGRCSTTIPTSPRGRASTSPRSRSTA